MKSSLSTGEFAKYCGVGHRTVLRWIKVGYLDAFQLPGRGDNRIPVEECVRFMRENKIPVPKKLADAVTPPRILLVEDDPDMVKMIQRQLNEYEAVLEVASDGFRAGAELMKFRPHLLILDLKIPELDGMEVLKFVQDNDELKDTKVLVMSGAGPDQLDKAQMKGAHAILAKPFSPEDLIDSVEKLLSKHGLSLR